MESNNSEITCYGGQRRTVAVASAGSRSAALARYDDSNRPISCAETRRHGMAPVRRRHPAYRYMRDRDGDDGRGSRLLKPSIVSRS